MEMNAEIIDKLIPLVSTLGGALIGALIACFVARQQFKATVLSKNRQEWINNLRDLLAEYNAILRKMHVAYGRTSPMLPEGELMSELLRAELIISQVTLLVNPEESDHAALLRLMRKLPTVAISKKDDQVTEVVALDTEYIALAQKILKREWERVKKGT